MMKYRIDIDFVGSGNAAKAYGGKLDAWSFFDIDGQQWFSQFRQTILDAIGKKYLPVYRMADGEFRFLMGRKYNFHRRPLLKEIVAVTAEKIKLKNPDRWKTSWGEEYSPQETKRLRKELLNNIRFIADHGYLACYINDNGLHAFTEYNVHVEPFLLTNDIKFDENNYIPFHFVVGLLVNNGWEDFYKDRNILVVSGTDDTSEQKIKDTILGFGASTVEFLRISKTSSMKDKLDVSNINIPIDLCLVAAGIGSANVLRQLEPLHTVVLDIGGFINCYIDPTCTQHGGIFHMPKITKL